MDKLKSHHYLIIAGIAVVGIGLVHYYNKSTKAKAAAVTKTNATNFVGAMAH